MRIDVYLCENGYTESRTEAKFFISEGAVTMDGRVVKKPSQEVSCTAEITVDKSLKKYVSRGGLKLEGALMDFGISVYDKICLDIGASSGGFTDCLLQNGAKKVYAVDSGSGQLVESIRKDSRVIVFENFNARYMTSDHFDSLFDLCVMDVSFISATYIIPSVYDVLSSGAEFICLIKPQFEVGKNGLSKGGIVKDEKTRRFAINKVTSFATEIGFALIAVTESRITGGDGNVEYLAYFKKQ